MSDYVLTAKVGDNSDLFPDVLKLYVPKRSMVLDMTWGKGVFWKKVDYTLVKDRVIGKPELTGRLGNYLVLANDMDKTRGQFHFDFRKLPAEWENVFNAVVLDPPYLYTGGFKTMKDSTDKNYNNKARSAAGINGVVQVDKMYYDGMKEAHRLLKPKGILIVKCQDQVMSGEQVWAHETYGFYGVELGFKKEDLFVMVQKSQPIMRHSPERQQHARRNHSYFLVFRRRI